LPEKDSYILAQSVDKPYADLLLNARHLNETFVNKAIDFISVKGVAPSTRVLICGAAFKGKPVTSDTRGSFIFKIIENLLILGLKKENIEIIDPKVDEDIMGIPVKSDFSLVENKFHFMIQLTDHAIFEEAGFDEFISKHCAHIISFWPKNKKLNKPGVDNLFLGGLR
jgi:UDP-glucose 6-dehydrogenase